MGRSHERRRRGRDVDLPLVNRGDAAAATWSFCGDESRRRRGRDADSPRGQAATTPWPATWIFRGDESQRRRGRDANSPRGRVAATPWPTTWIFRGDESQRRRGRDADSPFHGWMWDGVRRKPSPLSELVLAVDDPQWFGLGRVPSRAAATAEARAHASSSYEGVLGLSGDLRIGLAAGMTGSGSCGRREFIFLVKTYVPRRRSSAL